MKVLRGRYFQVTSMRVLAASARRDTSKGDHENGQQNGGYHNIANDSRREVAHNRGTQIDTASEHFSQ